MYFHEYPFKHSYRDEFLDKKTALALLAWCERFDGWKLKELPNFLSLYSARPPTDDTNPDLAFLFSDQGFFKARRIAEDLYQVKLSDLVDIQLQKMVSGHFVRTHTDATMDRNQSHRFLIHINRGWTTANGGFFMVFGDENGSPNMSEPRAYVPQHNSAFTFEINNASHHAVSKVITGERYTLMYSFRKQ